MIIFIKSDLHNQMACQTEEKLESISRKLKIDITDDISKADFIISIGGRNISQIIKIIPRKANYRNQYRDIGIPD